MIKTTIIIYTRDEPPLEEKRAIIREAHGIVSQEIPFATAESVSCIEVGYDG